MKSVIYAVTAEDGEVAPAKAHCMSSFEHQVRSVKDLPLDESLKRTAP